MTPSAYGLRVLTGVVRQDGEVHMAFASQGIDAFHRFVYEARRGKAEVASQMRLYFTFRHDASNSPEILAMGGDGATILI